MMTFSDYLIKNPNIYQNLNIDDPTKEAIYDWFQFREVCDDERFGVYFRRLLATTLNKYNQLLRIEPGISEYDWLVQEYREDQRILQEKEKGKENKNKTNNITHQYIDNQNGNIEDDLTKRGTDNIKDTLGSKKTLTNDLTNTKKGAITKGAQIDTNKETNDETKRIDIKETDFNINDNKNVEKLLPMEVVNIQETNISLDSTPVAKGIGDLDWTTATSQHQNTLTNVTNQQSTNGEQSNNSREITMTQGQRIDNEETTTKDTGTQITADSGENNRDITYNSGENNLRNINLANNGNSSQDDIEKENLQKEKATLKINQLTYTGRHKEIAEILEKASNFIKNSCSFDYLRKELEVVFMHIIDF